MSRAQIIRLLCSLRRLKAWRRGTCLRFFFGQGFSSCRRAIAYRGPLSDVFASLEVHANIQLGSSRKRQALS